MISRGALLSSQDNKWSNVCGLGFQSPALRRSASDPYHPQQDRVSQRSTPTSSRPAHTPSVLHQSPINNLSNNLLHSGHQTSSREARTLWETLPATTGSYPRAGAADPKSNQSRDWTSHKYNHYPSEKQRAARPTVQRQHPQSPTGRKASIGRNALINKTPQPAETPSRANVNALPAPTSRYPAGGSNCAGANQNFLHTILFTTPT